MDSPPYLFTQAFTGEVPFPESSFSAVGAAIVKGERPSRPDHPDLTEHLWTLTQNCWNDSAKDRPDVGDAVKVIEQTSVYPSPMRQTSYLYSFEASESISRP